MRTCHLPLYISLCSSANADASRTHVDVVADVDDLHVGVVFHEHLVDGGEVAQATVVLYDDRTVGVLGVSFPQTAETPKLSQKRARASSTNSVRHEVHGPAVNAQRKFHVVGDGFNLFADLRFVNI